MTWFLKEDLNPSIKQDKVSKKFSAILSEIFVWYHITMDLSMIYLGKKLIEELSGVKWQKLIISRKLVMNNFRFFA